MHERDKKRLQANSRELIHNVVVSDVQDYLYERGVLTQNNVEGLLNEKSTQKAARRLIISILPRKGSDAFDHFCAALREAEYDYLADKLESTEVDECRREECGDNKCKHERNTLLRNSKNLEDELMDLKEKVKVVSKETEKVRNVKAKVEDLEYENYMLRKQLSFYEEKEQKPPSTTSIVKKSSSSSSFKNGRKGSGAREHGRHSYSFEPLKFVPYDERDYAATLLYDETDDQYLDELDFAFEAQLKIGSSSSLDVVDGLEDDENEKQDYAGFSHKAPLTNRLKPSYSSCENTTDINAAMTEDILGYFYTGTKRKPVDLELSLAQYILVMRRAVDSMSNKHGTLLEQISRQVDISEDWSEMLTQLRAIFEDFLADKFHHSALFWGRTVALYTLSGYIARKCAQRRKRIEELNKFLTQFINSKLEKKIKEVGGWDSFCAFIDRGGDSFPAIFPASMIQAAITASHAQAHKQTRNSKSFLKTV